jgi:hypothetical protein
MPFAISLSMKVTRSDWLRNPTGRWAKPLAMAGQAFQSEVRKYPPEVSSEGEGLVGTYARTNNLAKQVRYEVLGDGNICNLIGPKYLTYLLLGTGIYGPKGAPITGNMFWTATKGPFTGKLLHANSIRGTIWPGKLDAVKQAIADGFKVGLQRRD